MSRILSILVLAFFLATASVLAQYPIPSFNITFHGKATFQEQSSYAYDQMSENCSATVWVYSLDGTDTYGPYTVYGGETLDVEIDEREWGTMVQSDNPVIVDVWIDEAGLMFRRL
jgi:hypothetical protein